MLQQYDGFYRHLTSQLIKNFQKKPHLHPKTFDFVDLPGTKLSFSLNIYEPSCPHIHSIYLVHGETQKRFEELMLENFDEIVSHHAMSSLQSVDARPIVPKDLRYVIGYVTKFLRHDAAQNLLREEAVFTQYPISKDERLQRRDAQRYRTMLEKSSEGPQLGDWLFPVSETEGLGGQPRGMNKRPALHINEHTA